MMNKYIRKILRWREEGVSIIKIRYRILRILESDHLENSDLAFRIMGFIDRL